MNSGHSDVLATTQALRIVRPKKAAESCSLTEPHLHTMMHAGAAPRDEPNRRLRHARRSRGDAAREPCNKPPKSIIEPLVTTSKVDPVTPTRRLSARRRPPVSKSFASTSPAISTSRPPSGRTRPPIQNPGATSVRNGRWKPPTAAPAACSVPRAAPHRTRQGRRRIGGRRCLILSQ